MRTKEECDKRATDLALKVLERVKTVFAGTQFQEPAEDCKPLVQCGIWYEDYGNLSDDDLTSPEGQKVPAQMEQIVSNFAARVGDISRPVKPPLYGGVDACFYVSDAASNLVARVLRCYDIFANHQTVRIDVAFI